MVLNENSDLHLISLVGILLDYVDVEPQPKPYLVKDGVTIIL